MKRLITSESVTEGHPDKVCDKISDTILDELLRQDPLSRVACETCVTTGLVWVMGEITTKGYADIDTIVRRVVREIGYTESGLGFDCQSCSVMTAIHNQSPDIALGVDDSLERKTKSIHNSSLLIPNSSLNYDQIGAGDQGMMYGYACRETDALMPMPIFLAHKLTMRLAEARKSGELAYLKPDGKSQVTVEYEDGVPRRVDAVVVSTQHSAHVPMEQLRQEIKERVIAAAIDPGLLDSNTKYFINPTGRFVVGGPAGDSGVTGRKIIADTYGGYCPHGGGAFSGKDPTKVDRSAAYMARYVCKNVVAAALADRCELQVSYAIGVARPVSMYVDTFGTGKLSDEKLTEIVAREFDFRPRAIIEKFDLLRPIYAAASVYGHFGRPGFPWEETDKAEELRNKYGGKSF
ncbi:MAG: methionine adenosyltransferase [Firmicutes bacterium]|nr:methionine adenosyltransferase [Bacillota bacterium]